MQRSILFVSFMLALLLFGGVFAEFPKEMNFQGKLQVGGSDFTGTRNITLKIFDVSSGGGMLWSQVFTGVTCVNGLFNVVMTGLAALPFDESYWVELYDNTAGVTLSPRYKLTAAPYCFRAEYVDSAINYVNSTANPARRTGAMTFASGEASTLVDYGDSIKIIVDGAGAGPYQAANIFRGQSIYWSTTAPSPADMYVVPTGKVFYLYGAFVTLTLGSIEGGDGGTRFHKPSLSLQIYVSGTETYIIASSMFTASYYYNSAADATLEGGFSSNPTIVHFSPPIKLNAGTKLRSIAANERGYGSISFYGYEGIE